VSNVRRCERPFGWEVYEVQPGNTLFSIARAVGSTVAELRDANCLLDVDNIVAGDLLFVPELPSSPVVTSVPLATLPPALEFNYAAVGCNHPGVYITSPVPGQRVTGVVTLFGTASLPDMDYYKIEVRPSFSDVYNFYNRYEDAVTDGPLGLLNTDLFDDGLHWVRLTVVDITGNYPEPCTIPLIFN